MPTQTQHVDIEVPAPPLVPGVYLIVKKPLVPLLFLVKIQIMTAPAPKGRGSVVQGAQNPPPIGAAKVYLSAQEYQDLDALIKRGVPFAFDITYDDSSKVVSAFAFYPTASVVALLEHISEQLDTGIVAQLHTLNENVREALHLLRDRNDGRHGGGGHEGIPSDVVPKPAKLPKVAPGG